MYLCFFFLLYAHYMIYFSIKELGKYHQNVELPCNAVSLLTNTAGYHLLTYADFQYQSRFSYNLYNTLIRGTRVFQVF